MRYSLQYIVIFIVMMCMASCHTQQEVRPITQKISKTNTKNSTQISQQTGSSLSYKQERRYNELFLEAIRQKEAEHIDAEYELLSAALSIKPNAPEAIYEMGVLKLSYTAFSDTLSRMQGDSLLHKAVRLDKSNLYYKETLATYLANSAKYREAIELYEEIADDKETEESLSLLIWLYKTSGDYAGAIRTIERLERIEGKSEQLSLEKFQTYLAMKDDEHAYQAIEDLCAEYPYDLRYRVLLGDLYDQNGYHEQALYIYKDVLTAEPDNSYAQISLLAYYKAAQADSLYLDLLQKVVLNPHTQTGARLEAMRSYALDNVKNGGDSIAVLNLFQKVLKSPQESRDMAELYAYYVIEKRMPTDSILSALHSILKVEPDYTKARLLVLQILLQQNNMEQVTNACHEGELYDPTEVTFYYYEGTALYRLGRDKEAIRQLQRGVERIDENTDRQLASDIYALLGDVLHECSYKEDAYVAYEKSLEYNPQNLLCLNNYAYFLSLDGDDLGKAERMSKRTIDIEGDNATYLDTYAWILFLQHDYTKARAYIEEALRLTSEVAENASIYEHAGDIAYKCGNRSQAISYWRKALMLYTDKASKRRVQRKVWRRRL